MAQNFLIFSRHGTVYYFRRRAPRSMTVDGTPEESDAMLAAIKATLQNLPQPTATAVPLGVAKPKITAAELLEAFYAKALALVARRTQRRLAATNTARSGQSFRFTPTSMD